jgi:hypothetical protein
VKRRPNRVTGFQWAEHEFADLLRRISGLLPPSERDALLDVFERMLREAQEA